MLNIISKGQPVKDVGYGKSKGSIIFQKLPTWCKKGVKNKEKLDNILYGQSLNHKIADEPIIPHVHTLYCMEGIPIKMVRKSEPRRRDS